MRQRVPKALWESMSIAKRKELTAWAVKRGYYVTPGQSRFKMTVGHMIEFLGDYLLEIAQVEYGWVITMSCSATQTHHLTKEELVEALWATINHKMNEQSNQSQIPLTKGEERVLDCTVQWHEVVQYQKERPRLSKARRHTF